MNEKVERALILIDQMIDYGDAPIGLVEVRRLLAEAQADDDGFFHSEDDVAGLPDDFDDGIVLTAEPPMTDADVERLHMRRLR
jgi:hypothetical protein